MSNGIQQTNIEQLSALQRIDTQFDSIKTAKGSLPASIEALEHDIMQIAEKKAEAREKVDPHNRSIVETRENIKYIENQVTRYEEQLKATKNDREFHAISEDIEVQKIDVKLLKKEIPKKLQAVKEEKAKIENYDKEIFIKENSLMAKQDKLHQIHEKTRENEERLQQERAKVIPIIEEEMYELYEKIRGYKQDAAVDIINNACNGCFIIVPPQRQLEIRLQKRIYTCENCGRILLNIQKPIVVEQPKRRPRRTRRTTRKVQNR